MDKENSSAVKKIAFVAAVGLVGLTCANECAAGGAVSVNVPSNRRLVVGYALGNDQGALDSALPDFASIPDYQPRNGIYGKETYDFPIIDQFGARYRFFVTEALTYPTNGYNNPMQSGVNFGLNDSRVGSSK